MPIQAIGTAINEPKTTLLNNPLESKINKLNDDAPFTLRIPTSLVLNSDIDINTPKIPIHDNKIEIIEKMV